ncbi:MAG: hypothetical protein LRZ85_08005, partial [Alphaproteobacteria bacterium]|nr:hypothetical protein [Alphaproteobacteria bacterium]
SYTINAFRPILLSMDFSAPMGEDLVDDFKVRYGGQIELIAINNFALTAKILGNFRRHETDVVRVVGFGAEFGALLGYYRPGWHIAGEFGFDKSVITHLKHSSIPRMIILA